MNRTDLALFFYHSEYEELDQWHELDWHRETSPAVTCALEALGVLRYVGLADYYPCDRDDDVGCQRKLRPATDFPIGTAWGRCRRGEKVCAPLLLGADERRMLKVDFDMFTMRLQRWLGIFGPLEPAPRPWYMPRALGMIAGKPAYFARRPDRPRFRKWLTQQSCATVFVPTSRFLRPSLALEHRRGQPVEIVPLEDVCKLEGEQVVFRREQPARTAPPTRPPSKEAAPAPFCQMLSHDGPRVLSRRQYDRILQRRSDFDLFVDHVNVSGSTHPAWRTDLGGKGKPVRLSAKRCAALVRLITAQRPLRVTDFGDLGIDDVTKLVERARRLLDVYVPDKRRWRAIRATHIHSAKAWQFGPPPHLRWAVLTHLSP